MKVLKILADFHAGASFDGGGFLAVVPSKTCLCGP